MFRWFRRKNKKRTVPDMPGLEAWDLSIPSPRSFSVLIGCEQAAEAIGCSIEMLNRAILVSGVQMSVDEEQKKWVSYGDLEVLLGFVERLAALHDRLKGVSSGWLPAR